jgi:hypothetical protein
MVPSGVGRVLAWTPPRTCGRVNRPPAVRHARGEWAATSWTWWHGWRGARFGMRRCVCRMGGAAGELESTFESPNWLQKEARGAAARIHCRHCRLFYACAGIRTWSSARCTRPPRPGLGSATMPVLDSCAIRSCFRSARAKLVAYAGRSIDGSEPRYLFPPGFRKSQVAFNLHRRRIDESGDPLSAAADRTWLGLPHRIRYRDGS